MQRWNRWVALDKACNIDKITAIEVRLLVGWPANEDGPIGLEGQSQSRRLRSVRTVELKGRSLL